MSVLTQHLEDIDESYFVHLKHAIRFAGSMFIGSIACLIHAIFPFLCVKTGSACITKLHDDMVKNRATLSHKKDTSIEAGVVN